MLIIYNIALWLAHKSFRSDFVNDMIVPNYLWKF